MVRVNAFGTVNEVLRHFIHSNRKTLGKYAAQLRTFETFCISRCFITVGLSFFYYGMLCYGRFILNSRQLRYP